MAARRGPRPRDPAGPARARVEFRVTEPEADALGRLAGALGEPVGTAVRRLALAEAARRGLVSAADVTPNTGWQEAVLDGSPVLARRDVGPTGDRLSVVAHHGTVGHPLVRLAVAARVSEGALVRGVLAAMLDGLADPDVEADVRHPLVRLAIEARGSEGAPSRVALAAELERLADIRQADGP